MPNPNATSVDNIFFCTSFRKTKKFFERQRQRNYDSIKNFSCKVCKKIIPTFAGIFLFQCFRVVNFCDLTKEKNVSNFLSKQKLNQLINFFLKFGGFLPIRRNAVKTFFINFRDIFQFICDNNFWSFQIL